MRKMLVFMLVIAMLFSLTACGTKAEAPAADAGESAAEGAETQEPAAGEETDAETPYKIGFAFYGLSNPVWAELVEEAVTYGKEKGCEVTYVDAGEDSAKQITQIENFITSGMDAIVVLAVDSAAVDPICKEAMDQGIYILDYSRNLEHAYCQLALDPVLDGEEMIKMITPYINEKYPDGVFEWAHLDIQTSELGVTQGNAIEKFMLEQFPESKLVANASTLTTEEGLNNTQSILQAHPDLRVVISQSAGGGVGGNEAIKEVASPEEYDEWLLFSIDATEQEVLNIINGDPQKGSLSLGGGAAHGRKLIDLSLELLSGNEIEYAQSLPITHVTTENAQSFYDEVYGK